MWKRTIEFAQGLPRQQRAAVAARLGRQDERRRAICDSLEFWRMCCNGECIRRHACSGDPNACYERHWESEDETVWMRAEAKARADGLSPRAVVSAANAALDRHLTEAAAAAERAKLQELFGEDEIEDQPEW